MKIEWVYCSRPCLSAWCKRVTHTRNTRVPGALPMKGCVGLAGLLAGITALSVSLSLLGALLCFQPFYYSIIFTIPKFPSAHAAFFVLAIMTADGISGPCIARRAWGRQAHMRCWVETIKAHGPDSSELRDAYSEFVCVHA